MYKQLDEDTITITRKDWENAGLTYDMLKNDSKRGFLKIVRRGINGNTLIDVKSIQRPERLEAIERALGKLEEPKASSIYKVEIDAEARSFYLKFRTIDDYPLTPERIEEYVNKASILNGLRVGLEKQRMALAKAGTRLKMGEFWTEAADWYLEQIETYPCSPIGNPRSLERAFKKYCNDGYISLIHGNKGNDAARKVSVSIERLFIALWRTHDKPFVNVVHDRYLEFVSGSKILHDKSTGEEFNPENFRHKGRAMEVSVATVWNYLKDVVNETAVYADRNGNFDYVNTRRPKQHRKRGRYSLSKISMDDVALSRKSIRGWVFKYIAVDVVSGYYFRPPYVVGKPTIDTIIESFRFMFCELEERGMPMPGELEVEHALMQHIDWLNELFPFVRFCNSPTEKRAEHNIKSLKYGSAKRGGHTRGRWYAKHEAYRCVRNKVKGDFVEPEFQPQTIVADDLADIETRNNELHPLQKTYPRMTRRDVFEKHVNPTLKPIEKYYLYRYIGNETKTSIYNNDYCPVQQMDFEISDFNCLKRLKPNCLEVTAYWMPEADGSIAKVYLYQDDNYIGEAVNRTQFDYNECAIERTEEDEANMLHQNKRNAQFDKFVKDQRTDIPKIGSMDAAEADALFKQEPEIIETTQPANYDNDDSIDVVDVNNWAAKAVDQL